MTVGPSTGLRVVLVRFGSVRFRLLEPDGHPYSGDGETTRPSFSGRRSSGSYETINDGRVHFRRLDAGHREVFVAVRGYVPFRRAVDIRLGESLDWGDVKLDPGVDWSGRVVDAAGAPVVGAATDVTDPSDVGAAATDARGTFVIHHVPAGRIQFKVSATGYADSHESADTTGDTRDVVLHRADALRDK